MGNISGPEELLLELEKTIFQNEILQDGFKEISIIYSTPLFSVVPASLFEAAKASEYLKFNSKILAGDYIAHDVLETQEIVVVYVPFMNINNYFFEKYGTFDFYHSTTVLLKTLLNAEKKSINSKVYLHVQKGNFDCIVIKNGKLLLCNNYPFTTPEDFVYYTLFCFEQLKLNPDTIETVFCGEVKKGDEIYNIAYTYIRNISFLKPPGNKDLKDPDMYPENFLLNNII